MNRSLVIAPQWIGDAVMSQPLMAALMARGETLSVAALPWVSPVYRAMPEVAEVIDLPFAHGRLDWRARRVLGRSWRGRFAHAYVLPNSLKSALLPWFAGIAHRVGYHGEGRYLLLNDRRVAPSEKRPPMVAFYRALVDEDAAVTAMPAAADPVMHLPGERVAAVLQTHGLQAGAYWVLAPGAEYGPAKCWPAAHYAELARSLYADSGQPVVLLGSGKEAALAEDIARQAGIGCVVLAGKTSLDAAMALIAGARGLVSNDSGLMHVGAAFGLPQVAVFGSTSPEHTPPLNARAEVVWLKEELTLDCAPCFERVCPLGHTRCLTEVAPERVRRALWAKVEAAAPAPQSSR
ncbi:MAG: lipopolysaccharide heptosyltransferase [Pseudomonadota bacterium]|jgi:heptosyltransferase-2